MIILKDVFKDFRITQRYGWTPFAYDMQDRYKRTGLQLYKYGIHTGIDYGVIIGTPLESPITGIIVVDDDINDSGRGIAISICDFKQLVGCRFYHFSENIVNIDQEIVAGEDIVGFSGKTAGKLTIGNTPHFHFELVRIDKNGCAIGPYNGAIDPKDKKLVRWVA